MYCINVIGCQFMYIKAATICHFNHNNPIRIDAFMSASVKPTIKIPPQAMLHQNTADYGSILCGKRFPDNRQR